MNEWDSLVSGLETGVPALDEASMARIEQRLRAALPRRRSRRWIAALIAAVLVLTACGYAAVTGQFSDWFWTIADSSAPDDSEELLSSIGTVIGQSQTADGATVTLNGAIWDGRTLLLSLTLDSDRLPTDYWTDLETTDSWLRLPREQLRESLRKTCPDTGEAELDAMLDAYMEEASILTASEIQYVFKRQTQTHVLQVQTSFSSDRDSADLELHLETLKFRGLTLQGPFDFSFTVERRASEAVYDGSALLPQEDAPALQITKVTLSPLWVKADFHLAEPVTEEQLQSLWIFAAINSLRAGEDVIPCSPSKSSLMLRLNGDGAAETGALECGPFYQVIDPAAVDAIELDGWLLDLETFTLSQLPA